MAAEALAGEALAEQAIIQVPGLWIGRLVGIGDFIDT